MPNGVMLEGGALGRLLGHEGGALINEVNAFTTGDPTGLPTM